MKTLWIWAVTGLLNACGGGQDGQPTAVPAATASGYASVPAAVAASLCQTDVGGNLLQGVVTHVHDGDTLTLTVAGTSYKIRLDSIDAPELDQPFGSLSQASLSSAVMGKTVRVAYAKTDVYGRIVGTVFTDTCQYVNLVQVQSGMAWFYRAYQCELSAGVRSQFVQAQNAASSDRLGPVSYTHLTLPTKA